MLLNISMDKNSQLTITDLASLKQIIEVACTRGTFQAGEIKGVGEVYERLDTFLKSITEAAEKAQANPQEIPQGDSND
jgi:tryptophanyl-tRNA synthetase